MQEIRPSPSPQDIICAETAAPPGALVVFGASGDLVRRKLLVSLAQLFRQGLLSEKFYILGCGRRKISDDQFRQIAQQAAQENAGSPPLEEISPFISKLYYMAGDYSTTSFYSKIKARLAKTPDRR